MVALNESVYPESKLVAASQSRDDLAARVDSKTFRQVRDLNIVLESGRVILNGHSKSYYVKQLATHALLDLLPGAAIVNAIAVRR